MDLKEFVTTALLILLLTSVVYIRPLCYQGEPCHFDTSKTLSETTKAAAGFFIDPSDSDTSTQSKYALPKESITTEAIISFLAFILLFIGLLKQTLLKNDYQTKKEKTLDLIFIVSGTLMFLFLGLFRSKIFPGLLFYNLIDFLFIIAISITTPLIYMSLKNNWIMYPFFKKGAKNNTEDFYTMFVAWIPTMIIYTGLYYYYGLMNPICDINCLLS